MSLFVEISSLFIVYHPKGNQFEYDTAKLFMQEMSLSLSKFWPSAYVRAKSYLNKYLFWDVFH